MDSNNVIFDLSSDEDVGWDEKIGVGDDVGDVEDCNWIQDFFNDFEEKMDGSGDVAVVSEDMVNPMINKSSNDSAKSCGDDDGDDDDCVILDGDPDKAVEVENGVVSDELIVVGEKGQVACRDYPHPRHLCAKFPFSSTPHETYCNQCHCFVCDSPAPCHQWGSGISSTDHCHATGKEEIWTQQRECLKKSHQTLVPDSKAPCTSMSMRPTETNQFQTSTPHIECHIPSAQTPMVAQIPMAQFHTPEAQLPRPAAAPHIQYLTLPAQAPRLVSVSSIQNHTPRAQFRGPAPISHIQYHPPQSQTPGPALIRACTTATNINMPNIRGQRSGHVMPINNLHQCLASQQLYVTGNNVAARDRRHNVGMLRPRVNVPPDVFKRTRSPGIALASYQKYGNIVNTHGSKYMSNPHTVSRLEDSYTMVATAQKNAELNNYQPAAPPNIQIMPSNPVAFQSHISSRQSVLSSPNQVPTQPLGSSHQTYVGDIFLRPASPQPQVPPQIANSFGNTVSAQPPVYSQPIIASNGYHSVLQQQNQTYNFPDTSFTDLDLNWIHNPASQSRQQPQAENSQLQGLDLLGESIPFSEFDCLFGGSTNTGSLGF